MVGTSRLIRHTIRILLTDYGTILTIVSFTAFPPSCFFFGGGEYAVVKLPTCPLFSDYNCEGMVDRFLEY